MTSIADCNYELFPKHIAIIMDGNSRWARNNNVSKIEGYKKGVEVAENILYSCIKFSIKYVTLYAFSLENWARPKEEVNGLLDLFVTYLSTQECKLNDSGINVKFIGNMQLLPINFINQIERTEKITSGNNNLFLNIALSYGSRQEIIEVVRYIVNNGISNSKVTKELMESLLFTAHLPEVDLLIRSGGEKRLSNFLLWQLAYSELYFCDVLWPDFTNENFKDALSEYLNRDRRYGK